MEYVRSYIFECNLFTAQSDLSAMEFDVGEVFHRARRIEREVTRWASFLPASFYTTDFVDNPNRPCIHYMYILSSDKYP